MGEKISCYCNVKLTGGKWNGKIVIVTTLVYTGIQLCMKSYLIVQQLHTNQDSSVVSHKAKKRQYMHNWHATTSELFTGTNAVRFVSAVIQLS